MNIRYIVSALSGVVSVAALTATAFAELFNIPAGDLKSALDSYAKQTGVQLFVSADMVRGVRSKGAKGDLSPDDALAHILAGTGFSPYRPSSGEIGIVRKVSDDSDAASMHLAAAPATTVSGAALETVTVTSSKIGGDVQNIPISITALSQEQLTATQTAGGPDLIKQVPNMTFTKTNFSGYSIQIRGIGTQAISVTTDPAVAVAFNDMPFIRNHFFEQEFYDVASVEVARGPQGTLYGRNATAGVVNLESAKPTDQFEAMASVDIGNYGERRPEGMINIPVVDDRLDIRVAGEWTKRQGYSFNETTGERIDGRDLWSGRVTIGLKPASNLQTYLIWEHFSEDDDRIRSAKQLCKTDNGPGEIDGVPMPAGPGVVADFPGNAVSQGCLPASFYSPDAFQAPLGFTLPYITPLQTVGPFGNPINPYSSTVQSTNLRVIQSSLNPIYTAKNDTVEFNADYTVTPALTLSSQTGFNHDFLYSAEDYNRFGSAPGFFNANIAQASVYGIAPDGTFCDPQVGCSSGVLAEDLSEEHAWQLSQEFRLASNFSGPVNFTAGGNYLHYETLEKYYVFINALTLLLDHVGPDDNLHPWVPGVSDNAWALANGFQFDDPTKSDQQDGIFGTSYIDPNPISHLNDHGHNYFLSKNPYTLNSYALFGEVNYNVLSDVKLIAGLRWTEDRKHFVDVPSWLAVAGWGYPVAGTVDQQWDQLTGRAVANWTPKLDFTDQTLVYASYAHGYKAGGANPPGAILLASGAPPTHPLTFKPEFVDAFELGTKNTLLDGALTLNGDLFYYNYEAYQISEIVDRTAINLNFDAHAEGAELEATWEPVAGLRFNFAGGWEDTALAKGQGAVDLMDRTAGVAGWHVRKPYVTEASNCIFPDYVTVLDPTSAPAAGTGVRSFCSYAYIDHLDPVTLLPYTAHPSIECGGLPDDNGVCTNIIPLRPSEAGYPGFDPTTAPNGGTGFSKNVGGNQLPNAPPVTLSLGAQYTIPLSQDWAGTARADSYWQSNSYWRVFNDLSYDKLRGYANLNLTLIFTNQNGWQVMLYDKNVFNTTAITGAFLNSDDSGLPTNVFLTDPKLIGIRVTKNW